MGDEVPPRKKFIQTHAKAVKNLDIWRRSDTIYTISMKWIKYFIPTIALAVILLWMSFLTPNIGYISLFPLIVGLVFLARSQYFASKYRIPNLVSGCLRWFWKIRSVDCNSIVCSSSSSRSICAVCGHSGQSRSFLPFPKSLAWKGFTNWRSKGLRSKISWTRAPVLNRVTTRVWSRLPSWVDLSIVARTACSSSYSTF